MTDYEIGIAVGVLIAWPVISIGVAITMAVFTHPRGGELHEIEMAVVHDIKKRNCRRHTGGCRGCALFVDRESGLDCAAMMMEQSLEEEKKS